MNPTDPRWKTAVSVVPRMKGPWERADHPQLVKEAERLTEDVGAALDAQWKDIRALLRRLDNEGYPNLDEIEEFNQELYYLRNHLMTVLTRVWRNW